MGVEIIDFKVGDLVRVDFNFASLEPFSSIGVITEIHNDPMNLYYNITWNHSGKTDAITYSKIVKL